MTSGVGWSGLATLGVDGRLAGRTGRAQRGVSSEGPAAAAARSEKSVGGGEQGRP